MAEIFEVSQINEYLRQRFEADEFLGSLLIRGELSNYKIYPSGHHYFTLKDSQSAIRCVMFKGSAMRLRFRPETGMKVIAGGRIAVFPRDGAYQLYCTSLTPEGVGDLHVAFEQLKLKLQAEGLFARERKQALPRFPHRIAIITSSAGAALHDMLRILRKRYPLTEVKLLGVRVQGAEAPAEIAGAIRYANRWELADLIITGRGGGSMEDLWAFNDERVAGAVYRSRIPVVAGIGHEVDTSIADMVADLRAATPSHAAQLLWPERQWYAQLVDDLEANLLEAAERRLSQADQRLDTLGRALAWLSPERGLARLEERFGTLARRLDFALEQKLERTDARLRFLEAGMSRYAESRVLDTRLEQTAALTRRLRQAQALRLEQIGGRLDTASSRLEERFARQFEGLERQLERHDLRLRGLDPEGPLERGYAYAFTADGHFVRSIRDVQPGASLTVKIRDGEADTRVTAVRATGESHDIP